MFLKLIFHFIYVSQINQSEMKLKVQPTCGQVVSALISYSLWMRFPFLDQRSDSEPTLRKKSQSVDRRAKNQTKP